ncbi:MAG: tetratricopeptide repeat protein [Magnetococcales bacterium]|nr:tetratricopeptide repeat protein [Magnetococcales bacterium]
MARAVSSAERAFRQAVNLQQAGRSLQAETAYRTLLAACPGHIGAQINLASLLRRRGQGQEARALLEQAATQAPGAVEIWFNLGNTHLALGSPAAAADCFRRILDLNPTFAPAHFNLANTLRDLDRLTEAVPHYQAFVAAQSDHAAGQANLGNVYRRLGQFTESEACQRRAIALDPANGGYHLNLAQLLVAAERPREAVAALRDALARDPDHLDWHLALLRLLVRERNWTEGTVVFSDLQTRFPRTIEAVSLWGDALQEAGSIRDALAVYRPALDGGWANDALWNSAGVAFQSLGDLAQAERCLRQAIQQAPRQAMAYSNLGLLLLLQGRHEPALRALEEALRLDPTLAVAHTNLALVHLEIHEPGKAEQHCRQAIALDSDPDRHHPPIRPATAHAASVGNDQGRHKGYANLAPALVNQGRLPEAFDAFERALEAAPDDLSTLSSYLFALNYSDHHRLDQVAARHHHYGALAMARVRTLPPAPPLRDPDPARPLRIGYLSPDFYQHPVGMLIAPILAHHDRTAFQAFCYSHGPKRDDLTRRIQAAADHWLTVETLDDPALVDRIRADGIDILVDLTGHTKNNRLPLFARRPAPVQMSYAGYVHGTGLPTMDWIIHDRITATPAAEALYHERIAVLPCPLYCYQSPDNAPPVSPAPALKNGFVTFGSFNNLPKLTPTTLDLWCRLLEAVPDSRLLLKSGPFFEPQTRELYLRRLLDRGLATERITLLGPSPFRQYLADYARVDVSLDPIPFNGGVTSLQGLWQGVPLLTLPGDRHVARVGASLMTALDLPECIGATPDDWVRKGIALCRDLPRLADIRQSLRRRMAASPLGNPALFTPHLETALRHMWQNACERSTLSS